MSEYYPFFISDFPNQKVDPDRLEREILDGSTISGTFTHISTNTLGCYVWFDSVLSNEDYNTLVDVVTAHGGAPLDLTIPNVFSAHNNGYEQTFTSETTINLTEIRKGDYFSTAVVNGGLEVVCNKSSWCKVNYDVTIYQPNRSRRTSSVCWLEINGVEAAGTKSYGQHPNSFVGESTMSMSPFDIHLSKGDVLRIRAKRKAGYGILATKAQGCRLRIELTQIT